MLATKMRAMARGDCENEAIPREVGDEARVRDVMVHSPKTLPADCDVADVRRFFANPHHATALLVDGTDFAGAIERVDMSADTRDDAPARELAARDVETIQPDAPVSAAVARLDERSSHRLVVLDPDGRTLRGLVCLTRDRDGFCQAGSAPR
jgi:CBS domain-containing protein